MTMHFFALAFVYRSKKCNFVLQVWIVLAGISFVATILFVVLLKDTSSKDPQANLGSSKHAIQSVENREITNDLVVARSSHSESCHSQNITGHEDFKIGSHTEEEIQLIMDSTVEG